MILYKKRKSSPRRLLATFMTIRLIHTHTFPLWCGVIVDCIVYNVPSRIISTAFQPNSLNIINRQHIKENVTPFKIFFYNVWCEQNDKGRKRIYDKSFMTRIWLVRYNDSFERHFLKSKGRLKLTNKIKRSESLQSIWYLKPVNVW